MIKVSQILAIKSEKIFNNQLKVCRGTELGDYYVIGYNDNEEEFNFQGNVYEVADYLNIYFGYIK